jgi:hypothetical protein
MYWPSIDVGHFLDAWSDGPPSTPQYALNGANVDRTRIFFPPLLSLFAITLILARPILKPLKLV